MVKRGGRASRNSVRFLRACRRESTDCTPVWFMRQAGRYLPEYQALREKYDLLTICQTPELAIEVTLQPLKRFDLDAVILFSDIMVPLAALGIPFDIIEHLGPVIARPIATERQIAALEIQPVDEALAYVAEAIGLLKKELEGAVPLIGFAGAPFTLASYLIEGKPSRTFTQTKRLMYSDSSAWHTLMVKLSQVILEYLKLQIRSGAQAVQLFDSWVGCLSPQDYQAFVLPYTKSIFDELSATGVPRIHFGTETTALLPLMRRAGGDVISIDWRLSLDRAWELIGSDRAIQGNLDPAVLLGPQELIGKQTRMILDQASSRPGHIFNLGHGILPETPPENVQYLVDLVHEASQR
jgi:uroporphyrinogen decarboxylase